MKMKDKQIIMHTRKPSRPGQAQSQSQSRGFDDTYISTRFNVLPQDLRDIEQQFSFNVVSDADADVD